MKPRRSREVGVISLIGVPLSRFVLASFGVLGIICLLLCIVGGGKWGENNLAPWGVLNLPTYPVSQAYITKFDGGKRVAVDVAYNKKPCTITYATTMTE